jgi:hypothetical protein
MAEPPRDGAKPKGPPKPQEKPSPNSGSFTPRDVLEGFVDPHRPEARITAPERPAKARDKDEDLGQFTAQAVLAGTVSPHAPSASPTSAKNKKRELMLPDLDDGEPRPPPFLNPFQSMKDIYFKVKGRASRRTQELLEGPDLEDLVNDLVALNQDPVLSRRTEARLSGPIQKALGDDPGPLLHGLNDPRLAEPWRLFLEGWDIWVPDKGEGVELFWEGETEDDDGDAVEILWVLRKRTGELELEAKLGKLSDLITFDGSSFFRLRNKV